jgi:hypothetical protein
MTRERQVRAEPSSSREREAVFLGGPVSNDATVRLHRLVVVDSPRRERPSLDGVLP